MKARWLQILVFGSCLFIVLDITLRVTGNTSLIPIIVILGSFIVPVAMTAYFYGHIRDRDISPPLLTTTFLVGGALGVTAAAFLEFNTLKTLNLGALVAVGFIEESAKLIFPLAMYALSRYRHEADGLLFGVAAGMGFAALETITYGMNALTQSHGNIGSLEQVLLLRGLLSPAGHAAWTGIVCSVIWRERAKSGHATFNLAVIGFFLLAVFLHFSWDFVNMANIPILLAGAGMCVLAVVSLGLLIARYREARRDLPKPVVLPEISSQSLD